MFDKFQRVNLEKTGTVEGTGLGLAITRRLLSMMNGEIHVDSVYGEGSVFTVRLPQQVASGEPVGPFRTSFGQSAHETKPYHESFHAPEARILIVDDTRMNLTVAVGLLNKTEIRIDTAVRGEDAVRSAASVPYDLILMDQRMPGMDGLEALRRIREQPDGASRLAPVICMTADALQGARERYIAEGFTDYLSKPIEYQALEEMLRKYLPADKLITAEDAAPPPAGEDPAGTAGEPDPLREAGLRTEEGLRFCQGSESLYRSVLSEYLRDSEEKRRNLQAYYAAENWNQYNILVHSLKSTSRTIGAKDLADTAAALEKASGEEDTETIHRTHGRMMLKYSALTQALEAWLNTGNQAPGTDEVLEFDPE